MIASRPDFRSGPQHEFPKRSTQRQEQRRKDTGGANCAARLPQAEHLEQEIQQLLEWELERMWKDRDFLRVAIPRAILDPRVGEFVCKVGTGRHAQPIGARLRQYQGNGLVCQGEEIDALANAIGALGFASGFMRQVVFGFDREQTKGLAARVARIFSRGLQRP